MKPFFLVLAFVCLFVPYADASSILVNGDFETGDFQGWTTAGWFTDSLNPATGIYDAATGCGGAACTDPNDPGAAYLYQDIATIPGGTYSFSFFYNSGALAGFGSEVAVLWGNPAGPAPVIDFVNVDTGGGYIQYTRTLTATSAISRLEFLARQDFDFYYLDDIALSPVSSQAVPEPASVLTLAAALLALGRRRRTALLLIHRADAPVTTSMSD